MPDVIDASEPSAKRRKVTVGVDDAVTLASIAALPVPPWDYHDRVILAPMVRLNTLPFRLLCRYSGATMLYSEELIANKVKLCERRVNGDLIEFVQKIGNDGKVLSSDHQPAIFVTYDNEPVVFQLGANNAATALEAALVVANDVRAIDLNMGCPERFSVHGGMGSALLSQPDIAADILATLRRNLPVSLPITCKIRMLEDDRDTVELLRRLEQCGVSAIGVHARYVSDRPARFPAMPDRVRELTASVSVPVIYNGDVFCRSDIAAIKATTGATSVMLARGAQWNASIFSDSASEMLPVYDVTQRYLSLASRYGHSFTNTKYCTMEIIKPHISSAQTFRLITHAKTVADLVTALSAIKVEASEAADNSAISHSKRDAWRRFVDGPYRPPTINWETRSVKQARDIASQDVTAAGAIVDVIQHG